MKLHSIKNKFSEEIGYPDALHGPYYEKIDYYLIARHTYHFNHKFGRDVIDATKLLINETSYTETVPPVQ